MALRLSATREPGTRQALPLGWLTESSQPGCKNEVREAQQEGKERSWDLNQVPLTANTRVYAQLEEKSTGMLSRGME